MADNNKVGGSGAHARSDDEDLENHYLQFYSQQNHDDAGEDAGEDDGYEENTVNNTTDTGGAVTDCTSGSASKHQRKERRQNMVGTGRLPITEVDPTSGLPVAP